MPGFAQSGRFTEMNGSFQFDPRSPDRGSIDAVIKTASLRANAWEAELRGSNFFNVAVFPEIHFKSRSVRPAGGKGAAFLGNLTMHGVTRPVTLETDFKGHHVSAKAHIKRSDFNMTALSYLVGDEIEIQIEAELVGK
jgi:polyisoprenoid-binding protein YceI